MLYTDCFDSLVSGARGILRDQGAAEDVVQDCFLKFAQRRVALQPGKERAYLRAMVRNESISVLRRHEREVRATAGLAEQTATRADAAEDLALQVIESERLASMLDDLSEQQRAVVSLRYVGSLSVTETADRLGVRAGTVKTHAHRGAAAMRSNLLAAA